MLWWRVCYFLTELILVLKPTEKKGKLQNVQWHQWLKGYNKVYRLERVSPFPIHDLNQLSLHAEFVVFYKILSLLPNLISMDSFSATILVVISTLISKEAKIFTTKASISVASDVKVNLWTDKSLTDHQDSLRQMHLVKVYLFEILHWIRLNRLSNRVVEWFSLDNRTTRVLHCWKIQNIFVKEFGCWGINDKFQ